MEDKTHTQTLKSSGKHGMEGGGLEQDLKGLFVLSHRKL